MIPARSGTDEPAGSDGPEPADVAELADLVAAAATSVHGVTRLHTGAFGEVATYLPGRRVEGVRLDHDPAEVHLVVTGVADLRAVAAAVRAAVEPILHRAVDVYIEDLELDAGLVGAS